MEDADLAKTEAETEATVKKTITAEEDNTDKVANFKEDQDIEDHVTAPVASSNQPKQTGKNVKIIYINIKLHIVTDIKEENSRERLPDEGAKDLVSLERST